MKVTQDEPGRLLTLEGDDEPRLPGGIAGGFVTGLLELADAAAASLLWHPSRVSANREAGTLEIVETHLTSHETRRETIPLGRVEALSVQLRFWRPPSSKRQAPAPAGSSGIELSLQVDDTSAPRARSLWLRVNGVENREEVAEFGYRLGAAIGLSYQRVVQCDPRRIRIEMAALASPGMEAMPPAGRRVVAEIVPRFDRAQFRSPFKVAAWSPGDEVRFAKPLEKAAFGCLPFVVSGVLAGPAFFVLKTELAVTILLGLGGLATALLASVVVVSCLPRRTLITWRERTIAAGGWFARRQIPFDRLAALELRCVRRYSGGRKRPHNDYRCDILAHAQGEAKPLELLRTESFNADPETPYEQALSLVTELAKALAAERRVTDYE